jgi:DNA-binding transcriptional LysR family regulator
MKIWTLNLRHLEAIARIAELGTINAAANAVNLSQPAVTQALARLEAQLGIALFERRHDGVAATAAATVLAPRIAAALDHIASPHVTMARLRALLALADTGSYVGAGLMTGLSEPSIHRAVHDLALSMRKTLVERHGKTVMLTETGRRRARDFRLARVELETGIAEIEAFKGREIRRIAIGAMPLARARVLPAAITRFLRRHPQVRLSIAEGSRQELVEPLRNGALDLMIGALRDPLIEADLCQKPLFNDVPAVIGRRGHPLAGKPLDPASFREFPWVMPGAGAPLRDSWDQFFKAGAALPLPDVPIESGSVTMIRQILLDSDFLTLMSPAQVAIELEAGRLANIADMPAQFARTIGITTRASWRPTQIQRELLADLEAVQAGAGTLTSAGDRAN